MDLRSRDDATRGEGDGPMEALAGPRRGSHARHRLRNRPQPSSFRFRRPHRGAGPDGGCALPREAPPSGHASRPGQRAEALPFRDACFDTIVSGLVLCSIPEVPKALTEMKRVTAANGQLRAMEHVRAASASWTARLQYKFQPFWTWLTGGCHPNRDTEAAVVAAGWTIESEGRRASGIMVRFVARAGGS